MSVEGLFIGSEQIIKKELNRSNEMKVRKLKKKRENKR